MTKAEPDRAIGSGFLRALLSSHLYFQQHLSRVKVSIAIDIPAPGNRPKSIVLKSTYSSHTSSGSSGSWSKFY